MPKEQEAIEILEHIKKEFKGNTKAPNINTRNAAIIKIQAIETVLNMLKERDEKIEYYKKQKNYDDQFKHELLEQIRCLNLDKDEKDRQIDLMARVIDNYDCQLVINTFKDKEHVKQYFERKSENEN